MKEIILKARGKINLSLDITGKRNDGYHLVDMIMQSVDIYDTIKIKKRDDKEIKIFCSNPEIPSNETNLAYKAARLISDKYDLNEGVSIHIDKKIPMAAGMAGGSSNAAAVLVGINELFSLNIDVNSLKALGIILGADVPFCIEGGSVRAQGIGEVLSDVPFVDIIILICKPNDSASTEMVYKKFDINQPYPRPDNESLIEGLREKSLEKISSSMANSLESVTTNLISDIDKIKNIMTKGKAIFSMMTGSGPTVFGLYKNDEDAYLDFEKLSKEFKDTYITKTSKGGVEIESRY